MTAALTVLLIQGLMGGLDTVWHHELGGLPSKPSARRELALHALREAIYAVVFLIIGWVAWTGLWAGVLATLLAIEVAITLADFVEEDRTRRLPPTERVLHTLMAVGYGVFLAVFAPVLVSWAQRPSGFTFEPHGWLAAAASLLGMGVLAWAVRDGLAVAALTRPATSPRAARASGRTVLVTGATGFIGQALVDDRLARGDRVLVLARDPVAARARFGPALRVYEDLAEIPGEMRIDAIVNLAGAPTLGGLWTARRKRHLLESRLAVTRQVLHLIARLERRPQVLINASAVGYYGDRGDELLTEEAEPQARFMSGLCSWWEEEATRAEGLGVRVCRLRLGLVFGWSGGPLPPMATPAPFGLAAVFGSGRQWVPWIALADVVRLVDFAWREPACAGPINAVAPDLVTQAEFTRRLARSFGRPAWLKIPAWALRLPLGEMADLFLAGQRVSPARLQALGFTFDRGRLEAALARPPSKRIRLRGAQPLETAPA